MAAKTIVLTTGTTWTVPGDWNSSNNTIRVIGGGGGGGRGLNNSAGGGGGGGGAYVQITNFSLTPGANVNISIGAGGTGATTSGGSGTAGANTWINKTTNAAPTTTTDGAMAVGGGGGGPATAVGAGGAAASSVGTTKFDGGAGGAGRAAGSFGAGGGGGAAGTGLAVGGTGGASAALSDAGGGGGGGTYTAATTRNGSASTTTTGGNGGLTYTGAAGGAGSASGVGGGGTAGGGGGGGFTATAAFAGGAGGSGTEFTLTVGGSAGSGGGGGGGGGTNNASSTGGAGGNGGLYGGGGGGGGAGVTTSGNGGTGGQGAIIITYDSVDTLYWISGNGTWDGSTASNWSTTSGGSAGSNFPTDTTAIIFDAASNQGASLTVTIGTGAACGSLNASAVDTAMTFTGTADATINGSITLPSAVALTTSGYSGTWNVTGTGTITPNTRTVPKLNINASGATVTMGGAATVTTSVTLTAGTLNLSTFTLTTPLVSSNNSNTRNITFGAGGKIVLTGNAATIWDFATATNFSVTGTTLVESSYAGATGTRTFSHGSTAGGAEANDINLSITAGTDTVAITAGSHIGNLIFTGFGSANVGTWTNTAINIYGILTISTGMTVGAGANTVSFASASATQTITSNGKNLDFPITKSGAGTIALSGNLSMGTATSRLFTLTAGTVSLGTATLTIFGSFSSNNANTRSVNFGTGKIVISDTAAGTLWDTGTVTGWTTSGTPLVEFTGGGATTKTINSGAGTEAQAISFSILNTAGTTQFTTGNSVLNLTLNGTFTFVTTSINLTIYGSYSATTSVTLTTTTSGTWTFAATSGTDTIASGGLSHSGIPITFNGVGGTWNLTGNVFNIGAAALTLTAGTLNYNSQGVTCGSITANGGTSTGSGTITNSGALTISAGTYGGSGSQTHASGAQTGGTIDLTGGTSFVVSGLYTVSLGTVTLGAATLTAATFTVTGTTAKTLAFGTGRIRVNSNTAATVWSIASATGLTISGTPLVEIAGTANVVRTISTLALTEAQAISFTVTSTAGTVTFTASNSVKHLTVTPPSGSVTVSNIALTIYGDYFASGSVTYTAGANQWTFGGTATTSRTVGATGITHDFPWRFNCTGVTYTQDGNIILANTNGTLRVSAGTLTPAGFNITCGTLTVDGGTVSTGVGTMTVNVATNYTSGSLAGDGVQVHAAFSMSGAVTYNISASTSFDASGLFTLTDGTLTLTNKTLTCRAFSLVAASTAVRTINYGTTGKIELTSSITETVLEMGTATNLTITGTGTIELTGSGAGTGTTKTLNMLSAAILTGANLAPDVNVLCTDNSTVTFSGLACRNLTLNGTFTYTSVSASVYGNYTAAGSVTFTSSTSNFNLVTTTGASTSRTISGGGRTHDQDWIINAAGTTFTLTSNLVITGTTGYLGVTAGTVNPNGFNVTVLDMEVNGGTFSSGVGTLTTTTLIYGSGSLAADGVQSHGTVTLNAAYDISAATSWTASGVTQTNVSLTLGTKTLTTRVFDFNVGTLSFGTGKIVLTSTLAETIWLDGGTTVTGSLRVDTVGSGVNTRTIRAGTNSAVALNWFLLDTGGTVTFSLSDVVNDLTVNGTFTLANQAISIYGNYTYTAGTLAAGINAWTLAATAGTKTFNGAGATHDFPLTVNGLGGTFSLTGNLVLGATNGTLTVTAGTLSPNTRNITCANLTVNGGTVGTGVGTMTVLTATNYTLGTLAADGTQSHNAVVINAAALTYDISTTTSWTASGLLNLQQGTISLGTKTITARAYSASGTATKVLNFGTSGKVVLTSSLAETVLDNNATGYTVSGTAPLFELTGGGATTKTIGMGTAIGTLSSVTISCTAGTVTFGGSDIVNNLTINNNAVTISNVALSIYGSLSVVGSSPIFTAGANAWTFVSTSAETLSAPSVTLDFPIIFNGVGGVWTLTSNVTSGATRTATLTNGTLALSTFAFSTGIFSTNNANTRSVTAGTGGKIVCTYAALAATVFDATSIVGLTTSGHPIIETSGSAAIARTIIVGALSEANTFSFSNVCTGGSIVLTATNTFYDVTLNGAGSSVSNIAITMYGSLDIAASQTLTSGVNAWTIAGTGVSETLRALTSITFPIVVNTATGVYTQNGNFTTGADFTLTNGTVSVSTSTFTSTSTVNINGGTFTGVASSNVSITTMAYAGGSIVPYGTHSYTDFTQSGTTTLDLTNNTSFTVTDLYTHTAGTITFAGKTLTARRFDTNNANIRALAFGVSGTSKLRLNSAVAETIFNATTQTNLTVSGTSLVETTGGGATTKTIIAGAPTEANALNFSLLNTAGNVTFTSGDDINNLTINGTFTLDNVPILIYGNFVYTAGTLAAGANAWTFAGTTGTDTVTPGGYTYDFPWIKSGAGTLQLLGALTIATAKSLTLSAGTFDPNSNNVTVGDLVVNGGTLGTAIATLTVNGTTTYSSGTLNGNGTQIHNAFVQSGGNLNITNVTSFTCTTTYTLTSGTLTLGTKTLSTRVFSSNNANARTIAFGTGKISITSALAETVWNTATVTNLTTSGTQVVETTGGGATTKTINSGALSEANSISFNILNTAGNVQFTAGDRVKNLTLNGTFTLNNIAISIYGNYLRTAATIGSGSNAISFITSTTQTINTGGVTHNVPFTVNGTGTTSLAAALTLGSTNALTLTTGTFNAATFAVSVGSFASSGSGVRTLTLGSGGWTVTGSGTVWDCTTSTNLTVSASTTTITLNSASAKTFYGGGKTWPTVIQGGAGSLTFGDGNTFADITNTTQPATIQFTGGTTTTFTSDFNPNGTSGNKITITSANGLQYTFSKSSGTVDLTFCNLAYCAGTGGAIWEADEDLGNTDNGGNSNWMFVKPNKNFTLFFV